MKKLSSIAGLALLGLMLSTLAFAQPSTPTVPIPVPSSTNLAWNHDGVDVDGFRLYIDDGPSVDLGAVTRRQDGSYAVPFPALTPSLHTLGISAYNGAGESGRATLEVRMRAVPTNPTNLHIEEPQ